MFLNLVTTVQVLTPLKLNNYHGCYSRRLNATDIHYGNLRAEQYVKHWRPTPWRRCVPLLVKMTKMYSQLRDSNSGPSHYEWDALTAMLSRLLCCLPDQRKHTQTQTQSNHKHNQITTHLMQYTKTQHKFKFRQRNQFTFTHTSRISTRPVAETRPTARTRCVAQPHHASAKANGGAHQAAIREQDGVLRCWAGSGFYPKLLRKEFESSRAFSQHHLKEMSRTKREKKESEWRLLLFFTYNAFCECTYNGSNKYDRIQTHYFFQQGLFILLVTWWLQYIFQPH